MKVTGKITKKETKEGTTAGKDWKRCSYSVGNITCSTFDTKYMGFVEGDEVDIEYEQQGNFFNIKSVNYPSEKPEGNAEGNGQDFAKTLGKGKKYLVTIEEVK